jgi:DNA-binding XRE family transcriptional regulator
MTQCVSNLKMLKLICFSLLLAFGTPLLGADTHTHYRVFAEEIRAPGRPGGRSLKLSIVATPEANPQQAKILPAFIIPNNPFGTDWRIIATQLEIGLNKNRIELPKLEPMVELLNAFEDQTSESHFAAFLQVAGVTDMISFGRAPEKTCKGVLSELSPSLSSEIFDPKEVASRVRALRKNAGLSQAELAQRLEVSQSVISRLESGEGNLTIDNLDKVSRFFGLKLKDLF